MDLSLLNSADLQADVLLLEADEIQQEELALPVVLLLDTSDAALLNSALRSGVRAVISRESTPEEIESAIRAHTGRNVDFCLWWTKAVEKLVNPA